MADTLGEAYLQIVVQGIDQAISEMKRLESATENSAKKSESTINNLSNLKRQILNQEIKAAQNAQSQLDSLESIASSRKMQRINDINAAYQKNVDAYKNLATNAGRSSQEIQNHLSTMAQRVKNDLKEVEAGIGRGGVGFVTASMNILKAAPAFAVATAAIGAVYGALRGLRDELIAGLSAVEDYQLKVASMGAFLTTFNKNLTQTNASEIYRSSNAEAQKLVQTMEILDARTIASGKDLTTMAEQFIKGGVKIDTANKASMDGFVNIANALKLLTQGQNQEIQMRQEIRALTQGQVRDQNIVVQTLKGIDPQIKEHIKLWKQQGTLIENVGNLLSGFGPAAKDLEQTWAVVGSTMSTIHDRILRGAFKPTYDSLIQTAKEWNRTLMNADGSLTKFSENIIGALKFMAKFVENFVSLLAVITPIAIGVGLISAAFGALNFAISSLTITMLQNPLTAGLVAVTIGLTAKTIYDLTQSQRELNSKTKELTDGTAGLNTEMDKMSPSSKQPVLSFLDELKTKASSAFNELNKLKGVDVRTIANIFARGPMMLAGGDVDLAPSVKNMVLGRAQTGLDKEEIDKGVEELKKYNIELTRQKDLYKLNNLETARYELTLGKYADTLIGLRATGREAEAQAFEDVILKKAAMKDVQVSNEKAITDAKALQSHQESSRKALNETTKSLQAMNLTQEHSQLAIWKSNFANKEWVDGLKLSSSEIEKFKKIIFSEADAADQRKAYNSATKIADDYYTNLQNKLESLQAAPGETEQLTKWENKFLEAMFNAGSAAGVTAAQLDEIYEKLRKTDELKGKVSSALGMKEVKEEDIKTGKLMEKIFPNEKRELETETLKSQLDKRKEIWDRYTEEQKAASSMTEEAWIKAYAGMEARQDTWLNGAKDGLDKYTKDTTSSFKTASDAVQRAFKSMEDALVSFVKTGKIDFSNFIDSMITDLIRFQIQQSVMPGVNSLFSAGLSMIGGMFGGSGFSAETSFAGAQADLSYVPSANGNAFGQLGHLQAFANGGAFTNSIVTQPTIFPFANGTGLMGEAGPEAIMPLERNSQGKLGVVSNGGGAITNIIINNNTQATATTSETKNASGGKDITIMIEEIVGNSIRSGRGSINRAMKQSFGATPVLVGR